MTKAQYYAMLEIAENGERFGVDGLNVAKRTMIGLVRRGWADISGKVPVVTDAGWKAVAADEAADIAEWRLTVYRQLSDR